MRQNLSALLPLSLLALACGDNGNVARSPILGPINVTTQEDTPVTIAVNATDEDSAVLTYTVGQPAHGTLTGTAPSVTYTPAANFNGDDAVMVTVSDGDHSVTARVGIKVTPVNDAPEAKPDTVAATEDVVAELMSGALLMNDIDLDGDALTITAVGEATHGEVRLDGVHVRFTPEANYHGDATFTYTASDGTLTSSTTVTLNIGAENDAPVAGPDQAATDEDQAVTLAAATLLGNDSDVENQMLTITAVGNAMHGTIALADDASGVTGTG